MILEGAYYGDALGSTSVREPRDFGLVMRGLQLREHELARLAAHLSEWLERPDRDLPLARLEFSCGMGSLFDQSLVLTVGRRADTLSGGGPVATLEYQVGRMQGRMSYLVDPGGLDILARGIETALSLAA